MQVRALPVSPNGPLAQLAEHLTLTQRVLGSNPRGSSKLRWRGNSRAHAASMNLNSALKIKALPDHETPLAVVK